MTTGTGGITTREGSTGGISTRKFLRWLKSHPIVCLAILTPGLPKYLSTSSPILNLVENPGWFFLQLAINVGQYSAGALLVREALIRWGKGWPTAFLLSLAYGITEEGLGDNTLFNSTHGRDGVLGHFGRFLGVNWIWSTGVLAFHAVYSICLPILLLGLAVPATRGRSLIGSRGMAVAFLTLGLSTVTETALVLGSTGFWMGPVLLVGSLLVITALVLGGRVAPSLRLRTAPMGSPVGLFPIGLLGFSIFPGVFLIEYGFTGIPGAASWVFVVDLAFLVGAGLLVRGGLSRTEKDPGRVALAFGFVAWQGVFGLLLTIPVFYTLPLVIAAIVFFHRLFGTYGRDRTIRS